MFEILFGWRKASKCKKLIRRVQCRIKLLKNKRCSIARQVRDDVAQLLTRGHEQTAFDRVEQLFKDESIIAVYDLLDHFCEFILIHLSYIRKHKDCPNDINEAISTLIFASARCGDVPELSVIRKLFGDRYGHRFATVALELLPGNLVNRQIKQNLTIKSVPNDVKFKLMDEIVRSCFQQGLLALEYYTDLSSEQKNKNDKVLRTVVHTNCNIHEAAQLQDFNIMEAEGKIVRMDFSSDSTNLLIENPLRILGRCTENSSSETLLSPLPKEAIYLDDIEEFKSPTSKDENHKDQRLFVFKSSVILKLEDGFTENKIEKNEKAGSRITRNGKASGKRQRKRPAFDEGRSVKDVESTIYYGDSSENSQNYKRKSHNRRNIEKKDLFDETHECSLDYPCYFCPSGNKDAWEGQKRKTTTLEGLPGNKHVEKSTFCHNCRCSCNGKAIDDGEGQKRKQTSLEGFPEEEKVGKGAFCNNCPRFCTRKPNDKEMEWEFGETINGNSTYPNRATNEPMISDCRSFFRATTMPIERLRDSLNDNILRSNSFPFQQPSHVHPKLPDYDQLSAKFMALKRANLQCKSKQLLYSKA